jgi:hypothetical protein
VKSGSSGYPSCANSVFAMVSTGGAGGGSESADGCAEATGGAVEVISPVVSALNASATPDGKPNAWSICSAVLPLAPASNMAKA